MGQKVLSFLLVLAYALPTHLHAAVGDIVEKDGKSYVILPNGNLQLIPTAKPINPVIPISTPSTNPLFQADAEYLKSISEQDLSPPKKKKDDDQTKPLTQPTVTQALSTPYMGIGIAALAVSAFYYLRVLAESRKITLDESETHLSFIPSGRPREVDLSSRELSLNLSVSRYDARVSDGTRSPPMPPIAEYDNGPDFTLLDALKELLPESIQKSLALHDTKKATEQLNQLNLENSRNDPNRMKKMTALVTRLNTLTDKIASLFKNERNFVNESELKAVIAAHELEAQKIIRQAIEFTTGTGTRISEAELLEFLRRPLGTNESPQLSAQAHINEANRLRAEVARIRNSPNVALDYPEHVLDVLSQTNRVLRERHSHLYPYNQTAKRMNGLMQKCRLMLDGNFVDGSTD